MKKADAETHVERQLAAALKSEPEIWTPDCLLPEQMIALAEQTLPEIEAVAHMAHVALCARCRREYAETVELISLAAEVSALKAPPETLPEREALSSAPVLTENAVSATPGKEARRPVFWRKWFAPGFGFALGAAAAGTVLFMAWNLPARVQRDKIASLLHERDLQRLRAERMEQENRTLGQQLATAAQKQDAVLQLTQKVARLNTQVKGQQIQVARLAEAETALEQIPLPTPDWILARQSRLERGSSGIEAARPQIVLVGPADVALETRQPVLECRPVSGVTGYQISLEMEGANEDVPAPRPLSATRWQVATPLVPGRVYLWEVTANRGSERMRSQTARFYVLNPAEEQAIVVARQKFARRPLALGMVYARLGMWDQAAQQFQTALRADPARSSARRLLKEITEQHRTGE